MSWIKYTLFILSVGMIIILTPISTFADDTDEIIITGEESDEEIIADDTAENPEEGSETEDESGSAAECIHTDGEDSTLIKTGYIAASCTEAGAEEYWTCTICEKTFSDQAGSEIPDLETWLAEGGEGYIAPIGHSYMPSVTKEPTCNEEGENTYSCENCGDTYSEPVPRTAHEVSGGKCSRCGGKEDVIPKNDGNWYYVIGEDIQSDFTGIRSNSNGSWRIVGGRVDFNCNSVVKGDDGWWYCKDGKVQFGYTGIRPNENGWWRIVSGKVDFNCNTIEKNENGWWSCRGGKVDFDYTGIRYNSNGWWRVVNGKVDFNCTSVERNENGWWYIKNGKVQFNYTGIKPNGNGWWRIVDGKVDFSCNSIEQNENGWWYCKGGKVQFDFTGVAHNKNGWWYCENGKVRFDYNGVAANRNGNWLVTNGRVTFAQNGVVYGGDSNWYYAKNGRVLPVTGFYPNVNGTWYVVGGKVNFYFTGTAKCGSDTRYVVNGRVQAPYGITPDNAQQYFVVFGDSVGEGLGLVGDVNLRHTTLISEALNMREYNFSKMAAGYLYETRGDSLPIFMDELVNVAQNAMTREQINNTSIVIIEGGLNDFLMYENWKSMDNAEEYLKSSVISFLSAVRSTYTNADIYFAYGEGPSRTWSNNNAELISQYRSSINNVYQAVKDTSGVNMIDGNNGDAYYYYNMLGQNDSYYLDGYHPSVAGHRVMADKFLKMLTK